MPPERISRRSLLKGAALGAAAPLLAGCATAATPLASESYDEVTDVVVVGSGAAGLVAAISASVAGARVVVLEKGPIAGGTTAKSGGVYWIPNHPIEIARGLKEPRDATLRAMCRASYPLLFDEQAPRFGLPANEYALIETLYDRGAEAVVALEREGALTTMPADVLVGPMPDYFEPPNATKIVDRRYWAKKADGSFGLGDEMVRQLKAGVAKRGVPIRTGQRVVRALADSDGGVRGVEVESKGVRTRLGARRGVIFASGGYTHNRELVLHHQPGPIFGGCAVPTNEGDFVAIAERLGAKLGHMQSAWRAQIVLEQALQFASTPDDVFMPPGDSMILVNRLGVRVVNEKSNYNERTRVHNAWDPVRHEWINRVLVMIYDRRSAELFGGRFPLPAAGASAPYVLEAPTLAGLASAVDARLESLAARTGNLRLDPKFGARLGETVKRWNAMSARGVDEDFERGASIYDRDWHLKIWSYPNQGTKHALDQKNVVMRGLAPKGPYYAILLGGGTLDTNGGPVVDPQARVLHVDGAPIPGLYGAGNCIASPTGAAYYAGGATLGPAVTFGWIAGESAARNSAREGETAWAPSKTRS